MSESNRRTWRGRLYAAAVVGLLSYGCGEERDPGDVFVPGNSTPNNSTGYLGPTDCPDDALVCNETEVCLRWFGFHGDDDEYECVARPTECDNCTCLRENSRDLGCGIELFGCSDDGELAIDC